VDVKHIERIAAIFFLLFLASPAFVFALYELPVNLPSWISGEDGMYLTGSRPGKELRENLSLQDFYSENLQAAVDEATSDFLPCKAMAQVGYTSLQRASIKLAGAPFGYEVIPAFYGSKHIIDLQRGIISAYPSNGQQPLEQMEASCREIEALAEHHPSLNWILCLVEHRGISRFNPGNDLVSTRNTYEDMLAVERRALSRVHVVDARASTAETVAEDNFHADHHFQVQGAVKIYNIVIGALGRRQVEILGYRAIEGAPEYGTYARTALCLDYPDKLYDIDYQRSDISVAIDGAAVDWADVYPGCREEAPPLENRFEAIYGYAFHYDKKLIEFVNHDLPESTGALLLISDSFDNSVDRLFAESYHSVYEIDVRFNTPDEIDRFLDEHEDIQDVVIFAGEGGIKDCFVAGDGDD
jgi:hypothetical protein